MAIRIHEFRELAGDLESYFVTALSDSGTDGDYQFVRSAGESPLHVLDRPGRNHLHRPTPTGVNCAYGTLPRIDYQNGDTVGGLNGNQPPGCVIDQGIAVAE